MLDFVKLHYNGHCECCNKEFSPGNRKSHDDALSIDRIDNNRGYTIDNICLLCWRCNFLKANAKYDEFKTVYRWWTNKVKLQKGA